MFRTAALIGVLAILTSGAARADSQADSDLEARTTAALETISACGERDQIGIFLEKTSEAVVTAAKMQPSAFSDDQWKTYQAVVRADLQKGLDGYLALMAKGYAVSYSVADLHAMTDFCRTPAGMRISARRGELEAGTFDVRQAWMRAAVLAAMQDAQQKIQTEGQVQ